MLKIEGLKLSPGEDIAALRGKAGRALSIREDDILTLRVLRRSVDARKEPVLVYAVAVEVRDETAVLRRRRKANRPLCRWEPEPAYLMPETQRAPDVPPVIVGAGPAGLFAALVLATAGLRPILLERGRPVERRRDDVERFWRTGTLDLSSNVQFGEGGAGAFSDGKLNTGTRDPRHRFILQQLVACGAPADILIDAKPHIGTDYLSVVLRHFRRMLLRLGTDIRFEHRLADLETERGHLRAVRVCRPEGGSYTLPCRQVLLAPGHSARDTFAMLQQRGVPIEAKPFAVGVRIEHRQSDCDAAQYRRYAGHPGLPAAAYKLACHLPNGRGVFSFCVCPGGQVVAAASEAEQVVTNGMSAFARDQENINGGLLVGVMPEDFHSASPLAGIAFQRRLEQSAFTLGGGGFCAPAQRVGDFLAGRPSTGPGRVRPSYRPGVVWTDLRRCLPPFVAESIAQALPILGGKLHGYDHPDAVLTAVESRSSSPVRILRNGAYESDLRGLYPCGEGAGYAGGILSAAADGMRCAEQICAALRDSCDTPS